MDDVSPRQVGQLFSVASVTEVKMNFAKARCDRMTEGKLKENKGISAHLIIQ